jgi:hypothetical protein
MEVGLEKEVPQFKVCVLIGICCQCTYNLANLQKYSEFGRLNALFSNSMLCAVCGNRKNNYRFTALNGPTQMAHSESCVFE